VESPVDLFDLKHFGEHEMNQAGFITRNGEVVPLENTDRVVAILCGHTENQDRIIKVLWILAEECGELGKLSAACAYYEKIIILAETPAEKAEVLLDMGQMCERLGDHRAALEVYTKAVELPQEPGLVSYFIRNNAGYCLNQEGRYREAERYCRAAIEINPERHNAHKNLGVALQGLKKYCDAARSFMSAVIACPEDGRALKHLEDLIAAHSEIMAQDPELLPLRLKCHEVAQETRRESRLQ
jgi:tetratricopeptide (TPR) repeat protein